MTFQLTASRCFHIVIFLVTGLAVGCNSEKTVDSEALSNNQQAQEIVERAIAKHGGWMAYDSLSSLSYTKRILLYDPSGQLESDQVQYHKYVLRPDLSGSTIKWAVEGDTIAVIYDDESAIKTVNGIPEEGSEESAMNTFLSGYYVTFQPAKLMDNPDQLYYAGIDSLWDGTKVHVVQPLDSTENADEWWYYIDKETQLLSANMVKHDVRYSFIENLAYDSTLGVTFNAHRKSYFVDSLRRKRYLRAEYFYSDYQAEFKEAY